VDNWSTPPIKNVVSDIYFGYCSGLLGVTGFETSANYIEEQKDGVFPKVSARFFFSTQCALLRGCTLNCCRVCV
jgi:hypothetical protein